MHRLVYPCDWLPLDFGAVGRYSLLFARERAARGEDVALAVERLEVGGAQEVDLVPSGTGFFGVARHDLARAMGVGERRVAEREDPDPLIAGSTDSS